VNVALQVIAAAAAVVGAGVVIAFFLWRER
jgi:hypothetical protein